ncbi:hypothetical protein FB466_0330 [Klugiella xanthotipulae]|uniref:FHA domain-containing protein n=1 Tax=Klugiella xanthotipulae TaxID=244735 RepID=A0A543I4K1_9MICO|nr:hypothetical protein FB466_0330 [Klugiella xanthotipulae]
MASEPTPDGTNRVVNAAHEGADGGALNPVNAPASDDMDDTILGDRARPGPETVPEDNDDTLLSYGVPAAQRAPADDGDTLLVYGVPSSERSLVDDGDTVLTPRPRERRSVTATWQHPAGPVPVRDDRDTIPTPRNQDAEGIDDTILNLAVNSVAAPPSPPPFAPPLSPYADPVEQPATSVWPGSHTVIDDTDPAPLASAGGETVAASVIYATTESAPNAYPLGARDRPGEDVVVEDSVPVRETVVDDEDTVLGALGARVYSDDDEDTLLESYAGFSEPLSDTEDSVPAIPAAVADEEDTVLGRRELDEEDTVLGRRELDEEDTVLGRTPRGTDELPDDEDTLIGFSVAEAEHSVSDSAEPSMEDTLLNPRFAAVASHDPERVSEPETPDIAESAPLNLAPPAAEFESYVAPGVDDAETVLNVLGQVVEAPLGLPAIPVPLPEVAPPLAAQVPPPQAPAVRDDQDTVLSAHLGYRDDETLLTPRETGDLADTVITPPPPPPPPARRSAAQRKRLAPLADGELPPLPPLPPLPTPPPARAEPRFVAGVSLTDGRVMAIVGTLIFGRKPRSTRIISGRLPSLVQVHSPAGSISATHLELRQEGMAVVATDLASANGTIVTVPGMSPRRMRQGEAMAVIPGTILDIGDGVALTILPFQRKDDA